MTSLLFDTHKAVKDLQEAGFDEAQAEAVVATVGTAIIGNVATKQDVNDIRSEIQSSVATKQEVSELRSEVGELRSEIRDIRSNGAAGCKRSALRDAGDGVAHHGAHGWPDCGRRCPDSRTGQAALMHLLPLVEKFGGDSVSETRRNYEGYIKTVGPRVRYG